MTVTALKQHQPLPENDCRHAAHTDTLDMIWLHTVSFSAVEVHPLLVQSVSERGSSAMTVMALTPLSFTRL